MKQATPNSLIPKLSSLGCNFAFEDTDLIADPEQTIIEGLDAFWQDKKIFTLLIGLLKHRLFFLINTKRLYKLSEHLDPERKALLFVVVSKVATSTGNTGFLDVKEKLSKEKLKLSNVPKAYSDPFYLERKGMDPDFKKLGLKVANFFDDQSPKKFKTLKKIYLQNPWIRMRALMGADYRADTIFLSLTGKYETQIEISKALGCHKSSISRIWASLGSIEDISFALNLAYPAR